MRDSKLVRGKGVFITGTDTGVGKTVVSGSIAAGMRTLGINVGVMKPFQTGAVKFGEQWIAPDADFLKAAAGVDDEIELISPIMLEAPLAPSVAASLVGRLVTVDEVLPAYDELCSRHEFMIVEGAGGLAVPIGGTATMRDLAAALGLPILIVVRPGLGTINHTFLTVEYAKAACLDILGIVISNFPDEPDLAEKTNPQEIARLIDVPVHVLRRLEDVDTEDNKTSKKLITESADALLARLVGVVLDGNKLAGHLMDIDDES